ncbi:MAG: hypothetical protein IPI88_18540 [Chitinophagaceae bacterium]|nr:hypothetical protein [Chitinophagaceae bacterium]
MQKIFFAICLTALLSNAAVAQNSTTYPVVVSFGSMCCGVPSDEPVIKLIKSFKKQYKIKQIAVDNIGPMGREGEYYLAFRLKEFSKAQKIKFIQQLKKTAATMKEQGYAEIKENETVSKADLSSKTISVLKF